MLNVGLFRLTPIGLRSPLISPCNMARMNLQDFDNRGGDKDFHLVYPHGPTLTVQAPAAAILSSGMIAYPVNRPIGKIEF